MAVASGIADLDPFHILSVYVDVSSSCTDLMFQLGPTPAVGTAAVTREGSQL
jgi:hypothetical protein